MKENLTEYQWQIYGLIIPKELKFKSASYSIDDRSYRQYVINDYPLQVNNVGDNFSQDRTSCCKN